ncbi:PRD domain-containing protein [Bacillus sp. JJ1566]|uniref:BglG family transcription antiterminator n=1 Tax=Bacillus sp. JJ1566 TaxID=3122961 RepID=UPI003000F3FE
MGNDHLISSRQESLLRTILYASHPVSYHQLSEIFKLSTRTIHREIISLKTIFNGYDLKLVKKMGSGLIIEGPIDEKVRLENDLVKSKKIVVFSQEERQDGILYQLLLSSEPIKYYVFSDKYGVSEATISSDLEKLDPFCKLFNIEIHRKPGIGVFIVGTEQDKRMALSKLLHKDITFEEWFELFQLSNQEEGNIEEKNTGKILSEKLQKFIPTENILLIEKIIKEAIESETFIQLSDRNYVNLIVHLLLAVERIKNNNEPNEEWDLQTEIKLKKEYGVAEKIVKRLEESLMIKIPETEVGYITLHLFGANSLNEKSDFKEVEIEWYDLTRSFIKEVEGYLSITLSHDLSLFDGLLAHLLSAINRLKLGLQIHNPMHNEVKQKFPDVIDACQRASQLLSKKVGREIPEDEIGYLAIHIGASILRMDEANGNFIEAIIVCASGMGTSKFLASKIEKEVTGIRVAEILSVIELKEKLSAIGKNMLIISTITIPFLDEQNYITVSPLLHERELELIQMKLNSFPKVFAKQTTNDTNSMIESAKYGEGMIQILRNFKLVNIVTKIPSIKSLLTEILKEIKIIENRKGFLKDIEKREKRGSFVLNQLALLHTKSQHVNELLVLVIRLKRPIQWTSGEKIQTILLLGAPLNSPKEHIEILSEISANLIEEAFIQTLLNQPEIVVKEKIEVILSNFYFEKVKKFVKEPSIK